MSNLSPHFSGRVHAQRKAQGLTQAELAEQVGATQPQISGLEHGRTDVLSEAKIRRVAELLEIPADVVFLPEGASAPASPTEPASAAVLAYCPSHDCPTALDYPLAGQVVYKPTFTPVAPVGPTWCNACGAVLERHCPNCRKSVQPGLNCPACGNAFITPTALPANHDPAQVARQLADVRVMKQEMTQFEPPLVSDDAQRDGAQTKATTEVTENTEVKQEAMR